MVLTIVFSTSFRKCMNFVILFFSLVITLNFSYFLVFILSLESNYSLFLKTGMIPFFSAPRMLFAQKETAPFLNGSDSFLHSTFLFFRLVRMGIALSFQVLSCFDLVEFIKDIII